jgi:hypothetical protein
VAIAGGGYVFGKQGHFRVAYDQRTVRMFQSRLRCAGPVSIASIPLSQDGVFGYHAHLRGRRGARMTLVVLGRFFALSRARGYVRARAGDCDSGKVRFLATLS